MPHYAHILSVSRLQVDAFIGFYEPELQKPQPVEISYRLYFEQAIDSNSDDNAHFFDYGELSDTLRDCATNGRFNLIEYMSMELFRCLRAHLDNHGGKDVKLWLQLNKIEAPVPGLKGGASFIHSDLPAGATFIPSVGL